MSAGLTLNLPVPTPLQAQVLNSTAKRIVVCSGRRSGKTFMGALKAAITLLNQQKVLIVSTSIAQGDVFWGYIKEWMGPLIAAKVMHKNETRRTLTFGRGLLSVRTGSDSDMLRGFDADVLILDECAYLDPEAWYSVGAPLMADRNGTAIFMSTPIRRNWFYGLYQKAVADDTGRWLAIHATTMSNPHLSAEAVAELAGDMTEEGYRTEILAEFLEGQGTVFRNIDVCAIAQRVEHYAGEFVMGVDTAQKQDYTVAIVLDANTRRQVDMVRFNSVPWATYRERITTLAHKWHVDRIIYEINSIGSPNFELLADDGLPVVAFNTTAKSKPPLIESLRLALEQQEIAILDDPALLGELGSYEYSVGPTGRPSYSAPHGLHDDAVVALALAWHGVNATPLML